MMIIINISLKRKISQKVIYVNIKKLKILCKKVMCQKKIIILNEKY